MKANKQNRFLIPTIGLLLGTCSIISAADILFITSNGSPSDSLEDFLVAEGHSVTRDLRYFGAGNANDFDLIIIGRDTASNAYASDAAEAAEWNAVTAPILCLNSFFYGTNSWGWITVPTTITAGIGVNSLAFNVPYPFFPYPHSCSWPRPKTQKQPSRFRP